MSRAYSSAGLAGKQSRTSGVVGETLTRAAMVRMGFTMIERVHTPWKIIRKTDPSAKGGSRIIGAAPEEKVSGDFRAIWPVTWENSLVGVSVLVESKLRDDRIQWSDVEEHQRDALQRHHDAGGLSYLSVVLGGRGATLMRWPIPGFGPGSSIRILGGEIAAGNPGSGSLGEAAKVDLPVVVSSGRIDA